MRRLARLAIAVAIAALLACDAGADVIEFADNFSASAESHDVNPQHGPGRQSGAVGRLDYVREITGATRGSGADALAQVGGRAAPGALVLAPSASHNWVAVSPDHDFGWLSNAVYEVDIDPLLPGGANAPDHWAGIVVGAEPCTFPSLNPAIAFLVNRRPPADMCYVWLNGVQKLTSADFPHHAGAYHLKIEVTGGAKVAFCIDGTTVQTVTLAGALPGRNYITLASYGTDKAPQRHAFANLRVTAVVPEPTARSPKYWMIPSPWPNRGRCLRELAHRDSEWAQTRAKVDGIGTYSTLLNDDFSDEELKVIFGKIKAWNKLFALEVPAIKPELPNAAAGFAKVKGAVDRFVRMGMRADHFAMDEPYQSLKNVMGKPLAYSADEVAGYVKSVREAYPGVLIGDIEPYPSFTLAELEEWITQLNASLIQRGTGPLDFFRLDVDWGGMNAGSYGRGSWKEVRALEEYCRAKKTKFSLIYWASDYPTVKGAGYQDIVDNMGWYCGVMSQGGAYASVGGRPDEYVVESWTEVPEHAVPETDRTTFTDSVLDFYTKYLVPRR